MTDENVDIPHIKPLEDDRNHQGREAPGRGFGNRGWGRGRRGGGRFGGEDRQRPQNDDFQKKRRWGLGGGRGGEGEDLGGFRRGRERGEGPQGYNADERLYDKVAQIAGPTFDLVPLDTTEKKFSNRARLYVGNISPEATEEDVTTAFSVFGEATELFINKEKNFGFIKMDYHASAEKAKQELDGQVLKGKPLRVRFAPAGASVKIKNLTPFVTNELLYLAFSVFGDIEKCTVIVDDRGKPIGEGIVEYARKGSASLAIRKCDELCYFLTSSLRPVIVTPHELVDETEGLQDKSMPRRNPDFAKEREIGPRFSQIDRFENEYGLRWKELYELFSKRQQALKQELEIEKDKLENEMELARYEHETEMLREQIRSREMDRDRQKRDWEMKERQAEEMRSRMQDQLRNQQEEMQTRMSRQDEEIRRRQQENNLFLQAHQLDNLLKQEEQSFNEDDAGLGFSNNLMDQQFPASFPDSRGGHWVKETRGGPRDDFVKRRRF